MAKFIATDFKITLNGTDLSTALHSVTLDVNANEVETTTFGDCCWWHHLWFSKT